MARIVNVKEEARRVYIQTRYGEPIVDKLKATFGTRLHWDPDRKLWWLAKNQAAALDRLMAEEGGGFDLAKETDRLVRADQLEEAGRQEEAAALRQGPPKEDPDKVTVIGKARYKGKLFYVRTISRDRKRAYLTTLNQERVFWADFDPEGNNTEGEGTYEDGSGAKAVMVKTYQPHTVGRGRFAREEKQTLGRLQRFLEQQRDMAWPRGCCTECGGWGPYGETCTECYEGTFA